MKKYFLLFIFMMLMVVPFHVSGEESSERMIVTFRDHIDYQLLDEYSIEVHHVFEELHAVSVSAPSSMKQELMNHQEVKLIEEDPVVHVNAQGSNWGYNQLYMEASKSIGLTGKGVKIGILDTGINVNHPDLNIAGGQSFVEGVTSFNDDQGHGTHVAGIIAAQDNDFGVVGIAPEAQIYAVKILDQEGQGNLSDVVAGINWAIEQQMDIINLSITSSEGSFILQKALEDAYANGMLIVAASGNALGELVQPDDVLYPARYSTVIAVGALNSQLIRSDFSYYGNDLEFAAPGEDILSTYIGTDTGQYESMSGTSMATAFVTGVAALFEQKYPTLSNTEIREMMQDYAMDLGEKGKDQEYGYGLITSPLKLNLYPDIPVGAWYEAEIPYLNNMDIITGYPDGKFHPQDSITRAEAVTMIGRAFEFSSEQSSTIFTDVPLAHYASGYINRAVSEGVVAGFPDQSFQPNTAINRGDVAVMLQRAFKYPYVHEKYYSDVSDGMYYADAINSLTSENISNGYPDGSFQPTKSVTRAEFAVLLAKAIQKNSLVESNDM